MLRRALIFIIIAAVILVMAGCGSVKKKEEDIEVDIDVSGQGVLEIEDIHAAFSLVGKPFAETGIPEEYRDVTGIKYEGTFFGAPANGSIYCSVYDKKDRTIAEITVYIYNDDLHMEDCIAKLKEAYGDPVSTGEEPYAEANGGSVYWERYDDGDRSIQISTGSNNSWYQVNCRYKLDKDETYNDYLSLEDIRNETGYDLRLDEKGITKLKIEKRDSKDPDRCEADYHFFYSFKDRYLSCDLYYNTKDYDPLEGPKLIRKKKDYKIYESGSFKYILWEDGNDIWVISGGNITEKELVEARKCFI